MTAEQRAAWNEWLDTRPIRIQELGLKYPPGTKFNLHGRIAHVVGYNESDALLVSFTDPAENYTKAVAEREALCACCADKLDNFLI